MLVEMLMHTGFIFFDLSDWFSTTFGPNFSQIGNPIHSI